MGLRCKQLYDTHPTQHTHAGTPTTSRASYFWTVDELASFFFFSSFFLDGLALEGLVLCIALERRIARVDNMGARSVCMRARGGAAAAAAAAVTAAATAAAAVLPLSRFA